MEKLFLYQQKAINKLSKYKVGALFMEPGTGKTRTAYELIKSVPGIDYILWLTPFQTKENLKNEISKIGGFRTELEIIGIETLSNSDKTYLRLIEKVNKTNSFIICDESLKIKNWQAKRTQRIVKIGSFSKYKLILNGTPLSRNVLDLWAQFEFLSPKILNMSLVEFKNTFCKYLIITKKINGYKFKKEIINGYENIDYLYALIKNYVFESELNIDIKTRSFNYYFELSNKTYEEYQNIKEYFLNYEYRLMFNPSFFLSMIQKLQLSYSLEHSKIELLYQIINKDNLNSTLVYCKFIKSTELVRKYFPNLKILTYGKHSYGLNLQNYNQIIYFDKTLDYALRLQSMRRIYRKGQVKDCSFFDITTDIGLERLIERNIENKETMLNYFKRVSFKTFINEL